MTSSGSDTSKGLGKETGKESDAGVELFYGKSFMSQWYPSRFEEEETVDSAGRRRKRVYINCEQYMMAAKARLFGDAEKEELIMLAAHPKQHKALGRAVKNFDEVVWEKHRFDIVCQGNLLKFSQNRELRDKLLATGNKRLAEASPWDRIWGIGLHSIDPDAQIPSKWRGLNLLGKALEHTRTQLRALAI